MKSSLSEWNAKLSNGVHMNLTFRQEPAQAKWLFFYTTTTCR